MRSLTLTRSHKTYLYISSVLIISALIVWFTLQYQLDQKIQFLAGIPLVGALLSLLVQIFRDQAAHERELLLQNAQNQFVLGASSHMANVAFDKHAAFSEQYVKEAQSALYTLFIKGPTKEPLKHAVELNAIRNNFVVWLTDNVENDLNQFESALKLIGANSGYLEDMQGSDKEGQERLKAMNEMYNTFAKVMGLEEWRGEKLTDELAIASLVRKLRCLVGAEELTKMRSTLIMKAANGSKNEN
jgi:hypothetical protein